ncbi:MAG: short-chain dehydrogenase/reductase [Betaproteobacteria bacterium]|nr:short-chain dehydrogenase/reductase [Betaproteobacteria bacterium]
MFQDVFKDKAVLISGGSSGIGFGIARAFHAAGAKVTITGLTEPELADARAAGIAAVTLDVANLEACRKLLGTFSTLDVLVNCAGMIRRANAEHDPEQFAQVIDVNLNGTQRMCALARPLLAKSKGSIVNTASMRSFTGAAVTPAYAASKGAVMQLTKSLAIAYADEGIRVNAIAPGWVKTPLTKALRENPELNKAVIDRTPMKRWADPEDMAGPVMFLCSPAAAFVTGVILPVDGGYLTM